LTKEAQIAWAHSQSREVSPWQYRRKNDGQGYSS